MRLLWAALVFLRHYLMAPIVICGAVTALVALYLMLPTMSELYNGPSIHEKARTLFQAIYWSSKGKMAGMSGEVIIRPDTVLFGEIVSFEDGAKLKIVLPKNGRFVQQSFQLANVKMETSADLKGLAQQYKGRAVRLEMYADSAIVWDGNSMLNVDLIQHGAAKPDPNPPSPAYHQIFAEYLWKSLKA